MPDKSFKKLETERLILRSMRESDLTAYLAYRNHPVVGRYQFWYEPLSEAAALELIRSQQVSHPGIPGEWFQFALERKAGAELIGHVALKPDEWDPRQAEIGFTLGLPHQHQGFAVEAVTAVLDYAFTTLNIHRVHAVTDVENSDSIALLERLGMRREGHFIENVWFRGKWGSEYQYAILKQEWQTQGRIIKDLCKWKGVEIIEGKAMIDHVHLQIQTEVWEQALLVERVVFVTKQKQLRRKAPGAVRLSSHPLQRNAATAVRTMG